MRYYAGNWATTQWLFRKGSGAEEKLDERIDEAGAASSASRWREIYDPETADFLLNKGLAFRVDALARPRAQRAAAARGRRRRGLRRPRGRADLQRRQRLELRRRPLPRPPAAGGGAGALRVRAGRGAGDHAGVRSRRPAAASATRSTTPRPGCSRRARSRSPTWSSASPGWTSRSTSRSRSTRRAGAERARRRPASREHGDRRRLRPQRAGLRGGAGAGRGRGDGAGGRGDDRRRHPQRRADRARPDPRRLLGRRTRWRSPRPSCARSGWSEHGLEWRWPEVDLAHPLDDGSAGVMVRSLEETAPGLGEDGARLAAALRVAGRPLRRAQRGPAAADPAPAQAPAAAGPLRAPGGGAGDAARAALEDARRRGRCSAASPPTPSAR